MDAQQLWTECSEMLRSQVSEATWKTWFDAIRPVAVTNGTVVLGVGSTLVLERLEGRYHALLTDALREIVGVDVPLRLVVLEGAEDAEEAAVHGAALVEPLPPPEADPRDRSRNGVARPDEQLNGRYTFD